MSNSELPIVCHLTARELQERQDNRLRKVGQAVLEVKETANGYAYRFPSDGAWLTELAAIIDLERQCCPFLKFTLTIEPGHGPIWLDLSGPQGTKAFLKSFLS